MLFSGPVTAKFSDTNGTTNYGSTNLPDGIVRIYREKAAEAQPSDVNESSALAGGTVLAVLAVPSWMAPSDFLAFVAPAAESISHLRIIL
jgi:BRCA1-associated protein